MRDATEQEIQRTIIDYLKIKKYVVFKHRNVGIYKQDTGSYIPLPCGEKGISDIIACSPTGVFTAIEVKKRGGKPSPDQLDFLARVKANGGVGILAYSLDDVLATFEGRPAPMVGAPKSKVRKSYAQLPQSRS